MNAGLRGIRDLEGRPTRLEDHDPAVRRRVGGPLGKPQDVAKEGDRLVVVVGGDDQAHLADGVRGRVRGGFALGRHVVSSGGRSEPIVTGNRNGPGCVIPEGPTIIGAHHRGFRDRSPPNAPARPRDPDRGRPRGRDRLCARGVHAVGVRPGDGAQRERGGDLDPDPTQTPTPTATPKATAAPDVAVRIVAKASWRRSGSWPIPGDTTAPSSSTRPG